MIRDNHIQHAFNGIRLDVRKLADPSVVNRNIQIYRNRFSYIRDNRVGLEKFALNWWVHHNEFFNCHSWISLDGARGGLWYIFSNIGWFDAKPGPAGDENNGGKVIKMSKKKHKIAPEHAWYVFNNSWYLRCSFTKKAWTRHLRHWNNAIQYCADGEHPSGVCGGNKFFGQKVKIKADDDVEFAGDVCNDKSFRTAMNEVGLPDAGTVIDGPLFLDAASGDFRPRPVLNQAEAHDLQIVLPDGNVWPPEHLHIDTVGAFDKDGLRLKGPDYRDL